MRQRPLFGRAEDDTIRDQIALHEKSVRKRLDEAERKVEWLTQNPRYVTEAHCGEALDKLLGLGAALAANAAAQSALDKYTPLEAAGREPLLADDFVSACVLRRDK